MAIRKLKDVKPGDVLEIVSAGIRVVVLDTETIHAPIILTQYIDHPVTHQIGSRLWIAPTSTLWERWK